MTTSLDKTARVWDAATGAELAVLRGHAVPAESASFSPDGTRVVTTGEVARVWDVATRAVVATHYGHQEPVHSASFSPDGTRVVTAGNDKTVRVWDARPVNRDFLPWPVAPAPRAVTR